MGTEVRISIMGQPVFTAITKMPLRSTAKGSGSVMMLTTLGTILRDQTLRNQG